MLHLELIRLVAIFLVLFNHTGTRGYFLYAVTDNAIARPFYMVLSILCKVAVPLFFMASGALLLPREESVGTVLRRRVSRMVIVLVLFSFIIYLYKANVEPEVRGFREFFTLLYSFRVAETYWFLYVYLSLLVMLPFLRRLARHMTDSEYVYLIVLQVLLVGLWPIARYLADLQPLAGTFTVPFVAQGVFFLLMGYFVEHRLWPRLEPRHVYWGVGLAAVAVALTMAVTWLLLERNPGISLEGAEQFFSGLILAPAVAVYVLLKLAASRPMSEVIRKAIIWLGGAAFGIYLIEVILRREFIFVFDGLSGVLHALPAALVWITVCLLVGAVVVHILKSIPVFKRLL